MAFKAVQDYCDNKQTRTSKSMSVESVAVTQVFRPKLKASVLTFTLSEKLLERARLIKGDVVNIFRDDDEDKWQVKLVKDKEKDAGYTISGSSSSGAIKFTLKGQMPKIAPLDTAHMRLLSDESSLEISPGEVTFRLKPQSEYVPTEQIVQSLA